jgi:hypothetical protein
MPSASSAGSAIPVAFRTGHRDAATRARSCIDDGDSDITFRDVLFLFDKTGCGVLSTAVLPCYIESYHNSKI